MAYFLNKLNTFYIFYKTIVFKYLFLCMYYNAAAFCYSAFSVKMWYPQILQAINDYGKDKPDDDPNICDILNSLAYQNTSQSAVCTVVSNNYNII